MKKQITTKDFKKGAHKQFGSAHVFKFITPHAVRVVHAKIAKEKTTFLSMEASIATVVKKLQENIESISDTLLLVANPTLVRPLPYRDNDGGARYLPTFDEKLNNRLADRLTGNTDIASFFSLHISLTANEEHACQAAKEYCTLFDFKNRITSNYQTRVLKIQRINTLAKAELLADPKLDRTVYDFLVKERACVDHFSREISGVAEFYPNSRHAWFSIRLPADFETGECVVSSDFNELVEYEPALNAILKIAEESAKKHGFISLSCSEAGLTSLSYSEAEHSSFHYLSDAYVLPIGKLLFDILGAFNDYKALERKFDEVANILKSNEVTELYRAAEEVRARFGGGAIGEECFDNTRDFLRTHQESSFLDERVKDWELTKRNLYEIEKNSLQVLKTKNGTHIYATAERNGIVIEVQGILAITAIPSPEDSETLIRAFFFRKPFHRLSHVYIEALLRQITTSLRNYLSKRISYETEYKAVVEKPRGGITDSDFIQSA